MQVHSVISNTIPEEVLHRGHLSVRFFTDGFAILLEDGQYTPLVLNRFSSETHLSLFHYIQQCEDWLKKHSLLGEFYAEATILPNTLSAICVPDSVFSEDHSRYYLQQTNRVGADETTLERKLRNRPFHIVYSVPDALIDFSKRFGGEHRILHVSECLLSASDQVDASDHQRGFMLVEWQVDMLEILMIREDHLILSNRYRLKGPDDLAYHILNTIQQLELDRKMLPLFVSGQMDPGSEPLRTLQKYIRNIHPLPYFIREIPRTAISENVILSEATKCE